jgi:WD40 repeat protein
VSVSLAEPSLLEEFVEAAKRPPARPYRSLAPFRFADASILVARDREVERLVRLITMYRGVLLYGESGTGKSSVVSAGVLPRMTEEGFWPHRVRVQPVPGQELALDRITCSDGETDVFLPSAFEGAASDGRLVLSADAFADAARNATEKGSILLVFDQFEYLVTLFPRGRAFNETQAGILNAIVGLLRDQTLRVKLLFVFREDYLASLNPLLEAQPELAGQSLRLMAPPRDRAEQIIRAPFERFPGHYPHELSHELAQRIADDLAQHGERNDLGLSELQIVCTRLWNAPDAEALLRERKVAGLLEDHLDEALKLLPSNLQDAAVSVLVHMITSSGTRNVVSSQDLVQRAHTDQPHLAPELLEAAIERLDTESGLIRRERRYDVELCELTSEFLIPRIRKRREELRRAHERRRERRRLLILSAIVIAVAAVAAVVAVLAVHARNERNLARDQKAEATYLGLASGAQALVPTRPDVSALLALAAYLRAPRSSSNVLAVSGLMSALEQISVSGSMAILHGDTDTVTSVAFDPGNPDTIVSASGDGTIRLWDTRTHRELGSPLNGPPGGVSGISFAPGGGTLASAQGDGTVRIWDLARSRPVVLDSLEVGGEVIGVAFSPNGSRLAAASLNGVVDVWNVVGGRPVGSPTRLDNPQVRNIAFAPDSRTLAAVANNGSIRLWDTTTGRLVRRPVNVGTPLYSVAFRPGGSELAAGGLSGQAWLWSYAGHQAPRAITGMGPTIQDLTFSGTGDELALARSDDAVWVLHLTGTAPPTVLSGHTGVVTAVAFSPSGRLLASGSTDRTIRLWNLLPHRGYGGALTPQARSDSAVAFSPDGQVLAAATFEPDGVQLWDTRTATPVRFLSSKSEVRSVAFDPQGGALATASQGGVVQLWNPSSGQPEGGPIFDLRGNPVYSVAFSPNGKWIAFAGNHGVLVLRNLQSGKELKLPVGGDVAVYTVAFNPDSTLLASGGDDRMIRLWSTATGQPSGAPLVGDTDAIFSLAFSPTGSTLASGSADDTVRLWNVDTDQEIGQPLTGHHDYVRSVAFSPDGQTLASGSTDGTIRFWDVASRTELGQPLSVGPKSVESVAFAPNGGTLASGGGDGATRLWSPVTLPASTSALENEVCGLVGAGLSQAEWNQYAAGLTYQPLCP